jgi:hypothetical protein
MPAASHRFFFRFRGTFTTGDDRACVAHTTSWREPLLPATNPKTGFGPCFFTNSAASSSAVPPISPIINTLLQCQDLFRNLGKNVHEFRTDDWITTDTDAGRLTKVEARKLVHAFVRQRSTARNNANFTWTMNVPWHDAEFCAAGE